MDKVNNYNIELEDHEEDEKEKELKKPIEMFILGNKSFDELMSNAKKIPQYQMTKDYSLVINFDFDVDEEPVTIITKSEENLKKGENIEEGSNYEITNIFENLKKDDELFLSNSTAEVVEKDDKDEKQDKEDVRKHKVEEPTSYINIYIDKYQKSNKFISNPIELFNALDQYEEINSDTNKPENSKYYPLANNTSEIVNLDLLKKEELTTLFDTLPQVEDSNDSAKLTNSNFCLNPENQMIIGSCSSGKIHQCSFSDPQKSNLKFIELKSDSLITCMDCLNNIWVVGNEKGDIYIISEKGNVFVVNGCSAVTSIKIVYLKNRGKTKKLNMIIGWQSSSVDFVSVHYTDDKDSEPDIKKQKLVTFSENDMAVCLDYFNFTVTKAEKEMIIIIGTIIEIKFIKYNLTTKEQTELKPFKKPPRQVCDIPDICLLKGLPPSERVNKNKHLSGSESTNEVSLKNLICISWGREVFCLEFPNINNRIEDYNLVSRYSHPSEIIRILTLTDNFLGIVDKSLNLIIIATYNMHVPAKNNKKEKNFQTIRFNPISLSSCDICYQKYTLENKRAIISYKYSLLPFEKGVVVFGNKAFIKYELTTWNDCINSLISDEKYIKAIFLIKEIMDLNIAIGENSQDYSDLIEKVNFQFIRLISVFDQIFKGIQDTRKCFLMLIELSVSSNICSNFLVSLMGYIGENKDLKSLFFQCLEHYILSNQFKNIVIDGTVVECLIDEYCKNKLFLTNLLLHLNEESLNNSLQKIDSNNLHHVGIYCCLYNNNLFYPVSYLIDKWKDKISQSIKNKEEYRRFICEKDTLKFDDNNTQCPDYLLHLVLWYINYCIEEKVYPSKKDIEHNKYKELITEIATWLCSDQAFEILLPFDSFSYFQVLSKLLTETDIYYLLLPTKTEEKDPGKPSFLRKTLEKASFLRRSVDKANMLRKSVEKRGIEPLTIIEKVTGYFKINQNLNIFVNKDFYGFIIKISKKINDIKFQRNELLEAIEFILNFNKDKKMYENDDVFQCHEVDLNNYDIINYTLETGMLLALEKISLTNEEIEMFLSIPGLDDFPTIKIYFNEKGKRYKECLKAHLSRYSEDDIMKKEEKTRLLFKWINDTLKSVSQIDQSISEGLVKRTRTLMPHGKNTVNECYRQRTNSGDFSEESNVNYINQSVKPSSENKKPVVNLALNQLKEDILNHLIELIKISLKEVFIMIDNWFSDRHDAILHKLDDFPSLQIEFVEQCLIPFNDTTYDKLNSQQREDYYNLIKQQIKLHCDLHKEDKIYEIIQKNKQIMDDNILRYLLNNRVVDSALFLYLMFGGFEEGVVFSEKSINEVYLQIETNLLNQSFNEKIHDNLIRKMNNYIENGIKLCLGSCEKETNCKENQEIWIPLLNILYNLYNRIIDQGRSFINNEKTYNYNQVKNSIGTGLKVILTNMSTYIEMTDMIKIITDNCGSATFKEFKHVLLQKISISNQINTILNKARLLFIHLVERNITTMISDLSNGLEITLEKCNKCNNDFNRRDKLILFNCGHKFHLKCLQTVNTNQLQCSSCFNKQEDEVKGLMGVERKRGFIELSQEIRQDDDDDDEIVNERNNDNKGLKQLSSKLMEKNKNYSHVMSLYE